MQYRTLGRTGLKVSALCLGAMQFGWSADEPLSHQILSAAYEAGLNFINTADIITSPIIGPNKLSQWRDNLGALNVTLDAGAIQSLNDATRWQEPDDE